MLISLFASVLFAYIEVIDANSDAACSMPPSRSSIFYCCHRNVLLNTNGPVCSDKISSQIQPTNASPFSLCLAECILKEGGITSNNQPNITFERAKNAFQHIYNITPEFIPIMENALDKCTNIVKRKMETPIEVHLPEDMCNPVSAITAQCMLINSFINCPKERWEDTDTCNDARDYLLSCHHASFQF